MLFAQVDISWLNEISDWVGRVGFPFALLMLVGFFMWRIVVWFKPYGEQLLTRHLEFTKAVESTTREVTKLQGDTIRLLEKNDHVSNGHTKAIGYLGEAIVESTDDARKPAVRARVDKAHEALNDGNHRQ